jgi:hypothetical protein
LERLQDDRKADAVMILFAEDKRRGNLLSLAGCGEFFNITDKATSVQSLVDGDCFGDAAILIRILT